MKVKEHELSRLAYDLRKDVVNMIMAGNGGHIGGDMSVMETLVTLYFDQMHISAENMTDQVLLTHHAELCLTLAIRN